MICELCQVADAENFHHLIPRTLHSNKWFKKRYKRDKMQQGLDVCRACHRAIHDLIDSEKELGRSYNTREKLLAHEELGKFVDWKRRRRAAKVASDERRTDSV